MIKKKPGIPSALKGYKKEDQLTLTGVIIDIINYVEVANGALNYLANKKCLTQLLQFKLQTELQFAKNMILSYFKVAPSYVQTITDEIHVDNETFQKAVKEFADAMVPDQSVLVTKNLHGEMQKIMTKQNIFSNKKR